jgi:hypothetical protein
MYPSLFANSSKLFHLSMIKVGAFKVVMLLCEGKELFLGIKYPSKCLLISLMIFDLCMQAAPWSIHDKYLLIALICAGQAFGRGQQVYFHRSKVQPHCVFVIRGLAVAKVRPDKILAVLLGLN